MESHLILFKVSFNDNYFHVHENGSAKLPLCPKCGEPLETTFLKIQRSEPLACVGCQEEWEIEVLPPSEGDSAGLDIMAMVFELGTTIMSSLPLTGRFLPQEVLQKMPKGIKYDGFLTLIGEEEKVYYKFYIPEISPNDLPKEEIADRAENLISNLKKINEVRYRPPEVLKRLGTKGKKPWWGFWQGG